MKKFNDLKGLIFSIEEDARKFYEKGNAAAGVRLRKTMQQVKTAAQAVRNEVTAKKKK